MSSHDTTLVIKNPSRSNHHFSLSFRLDGTIAELQQLLSETYDGKPAPADQTLIYGGKVLKDTSVHLRDIVSKHDAPEGPHSIHLVIKHKSSTVTPSPARSIDSSVSVSRASSSVNHAAVSAARPVPPPTRSLQQPGTSAAAATSGQIFAADAGPGSNTGASRTDSDDLGAAFPYGAWPGYPGTSAVTQAGAFGGYPIMRPLTLRVPAADGAAGGQDASTPSIAAAAAMASAMAPMQYNFYNPIVGCIYQAAYSAALAALSVAPQQQPSSERPAHDAGAAPARPSTSQSQVQDGGGATGGAGSAGTPVEGGPASSGAGSSGTGATASWPVQYAYVPMFVPAYGQPAYPLGFPGHNAFASVSATAGARQTLQSALPQPALDNLAALLGGVGMGSLDAELEAMGLEALRMAAALRRQSVAEVADGAGAQGAEGPDGGREGLQGLRQRRRLIVQGPIAVAFGNGHAAARNRGAAAAPRRAPRVFTIRISARMLLQVLVFAVVLYQHFTWRRFLALLIGGAVLFITSTWAPFRQLMRGIHAMPHRAAAGPGAAAAGGAAGAAGAGARQQQDVQRRGILHEILVFLVGFITSLLPAWNFNPEDAAAFAAAQEMLAAEERAARQQAAAAEGVAGDAGQDAPVEGGEGRRDQAGADVDPGQPEAAAAAGAAAAGDAPEQ